MKKIFSSRRAFFQPSIKKAFGLLLGVFLIPLVMMATHFRYGNISWTNVSGNTVVFKIQQSWRASYPWGQPIAVGNTINISGSAPFNFGDGSPLVSIILTITSVNGPEDWFYGEATIVKTYASPGVRTAFWQSGDRISTLQNNADGAYRVETVVNVGAGNSSPLANINPIVNLAVGNPTASFLIPALDPNGGTLAFTLANALQAAGGNPYVQPAGLSVNGSTGVVSFSTFGKTVGHLYTTQIIISDGTARTALDFIIRIVPAGNPPVFVYPPTPPNGSTLTVVVGNTLTFDLQASDPDVQLVTLSGAGVPVGVSFTPALGTAANPVNSQFSWTPTLAQVGSYIVSFQAQDAVGLSALTNVTIQVILCNMSLSVAQTTNVNCFGDNTGAIDLTITNGTAPLDILWSNGATTEDVSGLAAGAYSVTVTDANNCVETISNIVITQPAAALSLSAITTDVACFGASTGSINLTVSGGTGTPTFSWSNGATTEDITGLAAGSYTVTVEDENDCQASETFTVSEPATAVSCGGISVSPNPTVAGQAANTIFLGYGPQTVTLTGSGSGGTGSLSYSWSNGGTGSVISVSPTTNTTYTLTISDENGCTATCSVTINVVDARCGSKLDKVLVCHLEGNGTWHNVCVSSNSVAVHLSHGDYLGGCVTALTAGARTKPEIVEEETELDVIASPNPSKNRFTMQLKATGNERINIRVTDQFGRVIDRKTNIAAGTFRLGDSYKPGIYFVEIIQGTERKVLRLVKSE